MSKKQKLLHRALANDRNFRFSEMVGLLNAFGFELDRVSGSHHIFKRTDIPAIINIQNVNGRVKPYQVRQFLNVIETYRLELGSK